MNIHSSIDVLRFIALSHVVVILYLFWKQRKKPTAAVSIFFGLCVIGYLLADWAYLQQFPAIHVPILLFPFAVPTLFWLFSKALFDDQFRWHKGFAQLLIGVILIHYLVYFQHKYHFIPLAESIDLLLGLLVQLLSLAFIMLGIFEAIHNKAADLISERLQFRNVFVVVAASLMAITVLSEVSLAGASPPVFLNLFQKIAITGLTLFFSLNLLAFKAGFFPDLEVKATFDQPSIPIDKALMERLKDYMEIQQHWRTEGLSIRKLAEKMEVKEYRLRQTINQHLGYRNFNEYINGFRIQEACKILTDPAKQHLTILEIAYDLGFASLAPFNKVFKETTGMPPSEWRRSKCVNTP
ncbi:MAG: helix-turn-helix domain-containing protein [Haliscomenobacter sp.]|uniref:helix-turn-helix domain-containing protein n=1 Tax=Haliscomenobacter sp. TaxID=2717303 RepID=UPI0029AE89A4|nr:helix-turn-helix domain-containing protein [Haliscomenobacter sp.]MDX2069482.1 helix-turn-helix domain-containing protein [Haliscomenobacter sp.]